MTKKDITCTSKATFKGRRCQNKGREKKKEEEDGRKKMLVTER